MWAGVGESGGVMPSGIAAKGLTLSRNSETTWTGVGGMTGVATWWELSLLGAKSSGLKTDRSTGMMPVFRKASLMRCGVRAARLVSPYTERKFSLVM